MSDSSHYNTPMRHDFSNTGNNKEISTQRSAGRKARLALLKVFLICWSLVLIGRLYSLQIADFEVWHEWAKKQHIGEVQVSIWPESVREHCQAAGIQLLG